MKFDRLIFIGIKVIALILILSKFQCTFLKQNQNTDLNSNNYEENTMSEKNRVIMHYTTVNPKYVDKLTQQKYEKVSAEAETIGKYNKGDYYDGSINMILSTGECEVYSFRPQDCVQNSHCGWCEDSKKCVRGGREGAVGQLCRKQSFVYFNPGNDWDPLGQLKGKNSRLENNFDENLTYN